MPGDFRENSETAIYAANDLSHFYNNLLQLYRHGDRSPVNTFPIDEHKNYWKQGFGQLTEVVNVTN